MSGETNWLTAWRGGGLLTAAAAVTAAAWASLVWRGSAFSINADNLYIPALFAAGPLEFRWQPASNFFPDFLFYLLAGLFKTAAYERLIVGGIIQFVVSAVIVARVSGGAAWVAICLLSLAASGRSPAALGHQEVILGSHYGLIILAAIHVTAMPRWRRVIDFVAVIADPLFALILLAEEVCARIACGGRRPLRPQDVIVAWAVNFFLSETSYELAKFAVVLAAGGAAVAVAGFFSSHPAVLWLRRTVTGWRRIVDPHALSTALVLSLLVALGLIGGLPPRYLVALTCVALVLGGRSVERTPLGWGQSMAINLGLAAVFTIIGYPALLSLAEIDKAPAHCLAAALQQRGISAVGTDYWQSKPLSYVAAGDGVPLRVMPIDYEFGVPFSWEAAYDGLRGDVAYFVYDLRACGQNGDYLRNCGRHWGRDVLDFDRAVTVCSGLFEIVPARRPLTFSYPTDKLRSLIYNAQINFGKLVSLPSANPARSP